jgi:glucose/arabinose dehydrogenase
VPVVWIVLAAMALAACGSTSPSSSSSTQAGATSSSSSEQTAATSSSSSPEAVGGAPCAASQLQLAYAGTQGATGHLEVTFTLTNTGARSCTLRGYPDARLLGNTGQPLPLQVERGGGFFADTARAPATVLVAPGATAHFGLSFATNNEYAGDHVCRTAATALSSPPVAQAHWLRVSLPRAVLIAPCGDQLVVSPVY